MKSISFLLTSTGSILVTISTASGVQTCYYPDGTLSGDTPCNTTTTGHSACCSAPCMSSGLCFDRGILSRGSCTDSTWKDSACAQYCTDFLQDAGCPIIPRSWIDVGNSDEVAWCCDFPQANGSCTQGREIHVLAGFVLPNTTNTSTSTQSPTPSSSASICTSSGQNATNDGKCEVNHDAAIGVGIGVPAAITIASLLLLWLRERRIRKRGVENLAALQQDKGEEKSQEQAAIHNGYSGMNPTYQYEADSIPRPTWYEADGTPRQNELPS